MKTRQNAELMSIRFVVVLSLSMLGLAQVTLGSFPEFTSTDGVPEGVVVDSVGNVYVSVSDTNDQVWKYSLSGVGTLLSDLGESSGDVGGLALDNANNVYVCRFGKDSGVYQIAPDSQAVKLPGS